MIQDGQLFSAARLPSERLQASRAHHGSRLVRLNSAAGAERAGRVPRAHVSRRGVTTRWQIWHRHRHGAPGPW